MEKYKKIIAVDRMTASGKQARKNKTMFYVFIGIMMSTGIIASPLASPMALFCAASMLVAIQFGMNNGYHSEKVFALLPVERKDIVRARFLYIMSRYMIYTVITYLIGFVQIKTGLVFVRYMESNGDILPLLSSKSESLDETGIYNVVFFPFFAMGLVIISIQLKNYMKDNTLMDPDSKKKRKLTSSEIITAAVLLIIISLVILNFLGIVPLGTPFMMIVAPVIYNMASIANGFPFCAAAIILGVCHSVFLWLCTEINFESKEMM